MLVKRDGPEQARISMAVAAGLVAQEGKAITIIWVCVVVWEVLRGGFGESGRRHYIVRHATYLPPV